MLYSVGVLYPVRSPQSMFYTDRFSRATILKLFESDIENVVSKEVRQAYVINNQQLC